MKLKFLMSTVALLALAAPAYAASNVQGTIGGSIGWGSESGGMNSRFSQITGDVKVELPLGGDFSGQFDVFGTFIPDSSKSFFGKYSDNLAVESFGGAVHVFQRANDWLLGGFVALYSATAGDTGYINYGAGQNGYGQIGAEGQYYMDELTLYGQVGYLDHISSANNVSSGFSAHCTMLCQTWFIRGEGRYFWDDNTRIQANVAWFSGKGNWYAVAYNGDGSTENGWVYGVSIEHKFDGRVSIFVAWDASQLWVGPSGAFWNGTYRDNVFIVGFNIFLDDDSLKTEDRSGASLDTERFVRVINQSLSYDDYNY